MAHTHNTSQPDSDFTNVNWQMQQFIDTVQEYAIFLLDTTGHVMTWNEGARRIKGYEESEIIGKHFSCFYTDDDRASSLPGQVLEAAASSGRWQAEGWRVRQNGTMFWADVTVTAIHKNDELAGFVKITKNLSDRDSSIVELANSKILFSNILDSCYSAIIAIDANERILLFNEAAQNIFGYTPEEISGQQINKLIPEVYHKRHVDHVSTFAHSKTVNKVMAAHRDNLIYGKRKNGDIFPAEATISKIKWQGAPVFTVILQDISERRVKEEQLLQAQTRLTQVINAQSDAILVIDFNGEIEFVNPAAEMMFGRTTDELIGQVFGYPVASGTDIEIEIVNRERQHIYAEMRITELEWNNNPALLAVLRDTTERHEYEQKLEMYHQLFENAGDGIAFIDKDGYYIQANSAWCHMTGYPIDEIGKLHMSQVSSHDHARSTLDGLQTEGSWRAKTKMYHRDGAIIDVDAKSVAIYDEFGQVDRYGSILHDMTDYNNIVAELERTQQRLKTYMDHTPALIYAKDKSGSYTYVNKTVINTMPGLQGKSIEDFNIGAAIAEISESDKEIFATGEPQQTEQHVHFAGEDYWFLLTKAPVFDENGDVFEILAISIDISERKRAEQALAEERNVLRTLINAIPSLIVIKDREGKIITANEAYLRFSSYEKMEDIIGRTSVELFPYSGEYGHITDLVCMEMGEPKVDNEVPITVYDQSQKWYSITKIPLKNDQDIVTGIVGVSNDITQQRQANERLRISEAKYRMLASNLPKTALLIFNQDLTFTVVEGRALEDAGYPNNKILGKRLYDLIPASYLDLFEEHYLSIFDGEDSNFEGQVFDRIYDIHVMPIYDDKNEIKEGMAVWHDISRERAIETEIRQLNEDLELRVQQRTIELKQTNEELETFAYSVSHDLRAPLRAIDGYSRMLVDKHQSQLQSDALRLLSIVRESAQQMGTLIDALLDFSRLGRQSLNKVSVSMTGLVESTLAGFQDEIATVKVDLYPLPQAYVDRDLTKLVFQNLISNAMKYSSQHTNPEITIGCQTEGEYPVYFVKDNGIGFDQRYANKIFGVFQRLHRAEDYKGNGVGLAIVHRIISRHDGRIWVESEVNKGTTFYFTVNEDKYDTE